MSQQLPKEVQKFQEIKRRRRERAIALNVCPGAQDTELSTRGFTASGDTIALNVLQWRREHRLHDTSVEDSIRDVVEEITKIFPAIEDKNTAIAMYHRHRRRSRRNNS